MGSVVDYTVVDVARVHSLIAVGVGGSRLIRLWIGDAANDYNESDKLCWLAAVWLHEALTAIHTTRFTHYTTQQE